MRSRAVALLLVTSSAIFGQTNAGTLRFDVASARPGNPDNPPHGTPLVINHGRVTLNDASLRQLIGHAHGVQRVRVLDCPSWCDSEGFDVIAKAASPDVSQDQVRQMLQTLLAGRFKLAAHREAALLANVLDTPVEDVTGLKGRYDFTLEVADGAAAGGTGDPRDVLRNAVGNIGLKLESGKQPVEVVVVDHAERPSPN